MRRARVWRAAAPPGWLFVDSAPAEASKSLGGHQEFCSAWNYVESDGVVDRNDDHRVAALLPLGRKEDVLAGCADEQAQVGVLEVVALPGVSISFVCTPVPEMSRRSALSST